MLHDPASEDSWNAAADRATFLCYEPEDADQRWAGGFSSDGTNIEIMATVHGVEVAVSTSRPGSRFAEDLQRRRSCRELVWHRLMEGSDGESLSLPYVITVEPDDRTVRIGTEVQTVIGMRVAGDTQWLGVTRIGDVLVKIVTSATAPLSLRPCIDRSELPEFPPHH